MKRKLQLKHLEEASQEVDRLLTVGYERMGNWSLGQICLHMRLTMESNMRGYPSWMVVLGFPLRPILKWFALPMILSGKSPNGIKTAPMFVPPNDVNDAEEVERFKSCVQEFLASDSPLHAHPGFGMMTKEGFNAFHAAHAAHHLSFLRSAGDE